MCMYSTPQLPSNPAPGKWAPAGEGIRDPWGCHPLFKSHHKSGKSQHALGSHTLSLAAGAEQSLLCSDILDSQREV